MPFYPPTSVAQPILENQSLPFNGNNPGPQTSTPATHLHYANPGLSNPAIPNPASTPVFYNRYSGPAFHNPAFQSSSPIIPYQTSIASSVATRLPSMPNPNTTSHHYILPNHNPPLSMTPAPSTTMLPPITPPRAGRPRTRPFTPKKRLDEILSRYTLEKDAGRATNQLAELYFFGPQTMATNTVSTLDKELLKRIRGIILSRFGRKKSAADQEVLWSRCRTALGQRCKNMRSDLRKMQF